MEAMTNKTTEAMVQFIKDNGPRCPRSLLVAAFPTVTGSLLYEYIKKLLAANTIGIRKKGSKYVEYFIVDPAPRRDWMEGWKNPTTGIKAERLGL